MKWADEAVEKLGVIGLDFIATDGLDTVAVTCSRSSTAFSAWFGIQIIQSSLGFLQLEVPAIWPVSLTAGKLIWIAILWTMSGAARQRWHPGGWQR